MAASLAGADPGVLGDRAGPVLGTAEAGAGAGGRAGTSSRSRSTQAATLTSQVPGSSTIGSASYWAGATGRTCRAARCTSSAVCGAPSRYGARYTR